MKTEEQFNAEAVFFIDFCKAFAITIIFAWHYFGFLFPDKSFYVLSAGAISGIVKETHSIKSALASLGYILISFGYKITIFFVISSGYGLYLSYLRNPVPWLGFFKKRFIRIAPLYWTAIILYYFLVLREDGTLAGLLANLFFVQTYTAYEVEYGTLWFIGYILQLYMLFPALVYFFRNTRLSYIIFAVSFLSHYILNYILGRFGLRYDNPPTIFLPSFIFGMILARQVFNNANPTRLFFSYKASIIASGVVIAFICLFNAGLQINAATQNILFMAMFISMFNISALVSKNRFLHKTIRYISKSSYIVFLAHMGFYILFFEVMIRTHLIDGEISNGVITVKAKTFWAYFFVVIFALLTSMSYWIQTYYDSLIKRFAR